MRGGAARCHDALPSGSAPPVAPLSEGARWQRYAAMSLLPRYAPRACQKAPYCCRAAVRCII